jgi:phage-related protein
MTKADKLPPYFVDYMDERFKRLEDIISPMVKKVEEHDKWIEGFQARIGVIVSILGGIFALAFTLVKDVVANILKVR